MTADRWSPTKDKNVPLEEAYEDARELISTLEGRPDSPKHDEARRSFYGGRGWARHFGLACEDLDHLDYQIASLVTVAYEVRNRLRRELACVRTHLYDAFDEKTTGQTENDRRLWGPKK